VHSCQKGGMPPFQRGFQGVASRWEPAVTGSVNDVARVGRREPGLEAVTWDPAGRVLGPNLTEELMK
jgi:hypothetical protein